MMPALLNEPTRSPRPPSATGRVPILLTSRLPPYAYSTDQPQLNVFDSSFCMPTPKRHCEFAGSSGETFDESWNSESYATPKFRSHGPPSRRYCAPPATCQVSLKWRFVV